MKKLTSSVTVSQRSHSANISQTRTLTRTIQISHLAVATSGIASSAPAPNTIPPGHAKPIFSSIYTRHQSTVTILLQAHVIVDASFQGVGERRQLKTSVSLRKSRHKSITMDWQLRRALKRKLAVLQYGEEQVGWAIKEDKIEPPIQANCSRRFSLSY